MEFSNCLVWCIFDVVTVASLALYFFAFYFVSKHMRWLDIFTLGEGVGGVHRSKAFAAVFVRSEY